MLCGRIAIQRPVRPAKLKLEPRDGRAPQLQIGQRANDRAFRDAES
jgi:hypothetical protein